MAEQVRSEYRVAPLELFFDLVFVFAISQLSHHLIENMSWRGAAETAVLLVTVMMVWSYTSWFATMIPVHKSASGWIVLMVMPLGLWMNSSILQAFSVAAWAFVIPLLIIQLGRTVWTILYAPDASYREHFIRTLIWLLATLPLWIVGAWADPHSRLFWWMTAAAIELLGTWLAHPVPGRRLHSLRMPFNAEHMLERCNLFLIIALGETVLTAGTSLAANPTDPLTLMTGGFALIGTIALWALAFGSAQWHTQRHIEHTLDPVHVSRHAMNGVTAMVAGLVALAVANEAVISQPMGDVSPMLGLMIAGGPTLFLAAQSWYLNAVMGIRSYVHWVGTVVVALSGILSLAMPRFGAVMVMGLVLAFLATYDWSRPQRS